MTSTSYPVNSHKAYHAHVYFDQATLMFASSLCTHVGELFNVPVGRIHQRPIGPHPKWSCQITFESHQFDQFIAWLDANRQGLSVLVHPLSSDHLSDHSTHAAWLGDAYGLDLSIFNN